MSIMTVGQDVDAYCISCKLVLAHTIVSLKGGPGSKPHRLICKTCNKTHAYRLGPPGTKKGKVAKNPKKTEYERAIRGIDLLAAVPYRVNGTFKPQDVINHSKLGLGLVITEIGPNKIDVLFPDGLKRLVHGI